MNVKYLLEELKKLGVLDEEKKADEKKVTYIVLTYGTIPVGLLEMKGTIISIKS